MKVKIKGVDGEVAAHEFVANFVQTVDEEDRVGSIKFNIRRWKDDPEIKKDIPIKYVSEYTLYHDDGKEIETIIIDKEIKTKEKE